MTNSTSRDELIADLLHALPVNAGNITLVRVTGEQFEHLVDGGAVPDVSDEDARGHVVGILATAACNDWLNPGSAGVLVVSTRTGIPVLHLPLDAEGVAGLLSLFEALGVPTAPEPVVARIEFPLHTNPAHGDTPTSRQGRMSC